MESTIAVVVMGFIGLATVIAAGSMRDGPEGAAPAPQGMQPPQAAALMPPPERLPSILKPLQQQQPQQQQPQKQPQIDQRNPVANRIMEEGLNVAELKYKKSKLEKKLAEQNAQAQALPPLKYNKFDKADDINVPV